MQNPTITDRQRKKDHLKFLLFIFLLTLILFSLKASAQGDLLLYPKRVVFEGSKRSQTINLANSGKDTVRYLISVFQGRMTVDGGFESINQPDPGQLFADKNFRFFPRSVVLAPNEAQSVKIQLINTNGLSQGEYRSHIYFRAEPDKKPLGEAETIKDTNAIAVNLVAVFGISIPVIIRIGESTTHVDLADASIQFDKDSISLLKVNFKRTGNMSVYGDFTVDHISTQGKSTRLGLAKGIAIYAPNSLRHFKLLLDKNKDVDYHSGKLRIAYTAQADAKSARIAETELLLF